MFELDHRTSHETPDRAKLSVAKTILLAAVLVSPVLTMYIPHFIGGHDGKTSTGFIQYDMPIYMAKAREYVDHGFTMTYANPSEPVYGTPRVYFQPWTWALGVIYGMTGWDVGAIYFGFWVVSAVGCGYVSIRLYEDMVGLNGLPEKIGLLIFFWGGGLIAASAVLDSLVTKGVFEFRGATLYRFDPGEGWWFLNFGRNLVFPTEAFYHLLFLATIRCTLNRHFALATLCAILTAASSPFTGVELLSILCAWLAIEVFFLHNQEGLCRYFVAIFAVLIGCLGYYIVFLSRYPEHRIIAEQMSLNWDGFHATNFIPAYALVASFALWRIRNFREAALTLASPSSRLFLIWAIVAFGLANHEFAIRPRQPIHFTRGYIWTALYLLGLPTLLTLLHRLSALRFRPIGIALACGVILPLFLADNFFWFGRYLVAYARSGLVEGFRIPATQREIYTFLSEPLQRGHILLCNNRDVSYLATAYTPLQCWASHYLETPHFADQERDLAALFQNGVFQKEWLQQPLVILAVGPATNSPAFSNNLWLSEHNLKLIFENDFGRVYSREPDSASAIPDGSRAQ